VENNNQNAANLLSNRLAKSLLRFLRPIRVGFPRSPGDPKPRHHSKTASGNLLESKIAAPTPGLVQPNNNPLPPKELVPKVSKNLPSSEETDTDPTAPLDKTPAQWLDLVVYLLTACKKASNKIRSRKGVSSYQKEMGARGSARIKAVGSIIDTVTIINPGTEEDDKTNPELPDDGTNQFKKTG